MKVEIICGENWVIKCLEGTTERSDSNRARSARGKVWTRFAWKAVRQRTKEQNAFTGVVPSRHIVLATPFRALRTRLPKATLCSAFQALSTI